MMYLRHELSRRALLAAFGVGAALVPVLGNAASLTGIVALDYSAIPVRRPASVMLEAITRTGNRLVAVGVHGIIIFSDDSGQTWTQASVPVDLTLTCVGFATPLIGWAAGHAGAILHTTDGGETWQLQLNGFQVNQLIAAEAQNMTPLEATAPAAAHALRRASVFVNSGPVYPFLGMFVFSPSKALIMGSDRLAMMTNDGGKTWTDWSLRIYDMFSHNIYAAARIGGKIYLAGETGLVFCSADGGETFPAVTSPASVTWFGVIGASDGSVLVFGVAGNLYRSKDGGTTWARASVATQDNLTAGRILTSGDVLVATEAGAMFISKDNGATFSDVSGVPPTSIFDFEQLPDGRLVLVGGGGVVFAPDVVLS